MDSASLLFSTWAVPTYEQRLLSLLRALDTEPSTPAWTFHPPHTVGFRQRRRCLEALIHRWDAERAGGAGSCTAARGTPCNSQRPTPAPRGPKAPARRWPRPPLPRRTSCSCRGVGCRPRAGPSPGDGDQQAGRNKRRSRRQPVHAQLRAGPLHPRHPIQAPWPARGRRVGLPTSIPARAAPPGCEIPLSH
jgi:hypothetical protein